MDWIWSLDAFTGRCDPELINLVKRHNEHFKEMGVMTPQALIYDDKENPNKLLKQLRDKYDFFSTSKWVLEKYKNRKCGRLNAFEDELIKYLEGFYTDLYPPYELNLIGTIDTLEKRIYLERANVNYSQQVS